MSNGGASREGEGMEGEGIVGFMLRMRGYGVINPQLLKAVEAAPHDHFVPVEYFERAWQPFALPMACGQTMYAPDLTVRMIDALKPERHHSVLDIGTGSGFQAAILAHLAKKVHSVDRYQTLIDAAKARLQRLNIANVAFSQEDANSKSSSGLFDRIVADLSYESVPRHLLDRLASGGVVVAAIGAAGAEQEVVRLTKIGSRFERENLFRARLGTFEQGIATAI